MVPAGWGLAGTTQDQKQNGPAATGPQRQIETEISHVSNDNVPGGGIMSIRQTLNAISADMAEDMRRFEQAEFNGRNVSELFGNHAAAIARLAEIVGTLLPEDPQMGECPLCSRRLPIGPDGQLAPHEIHEGLKRSPFCRYRRRPNTAPTTEDDYPREDVETDEALPDGVEGVQLGRTAEAVTA